MSVDAIAELTAEVGVLHEGCALVDRSSRGALLVSGAEAAEFLQGQVSNEVEALAPGVGAYAALLTPKGKMLADLRVLRTPSGFVLDTEAVALEPLQRHLATYKIGRDVTIEDRSATWGLLSLQGPEARAVLAAAGGPAQGLGAEEHSSLEADLAGANCTVVAAEHGGSGVDLLCPASDLQAVRAALVEAGAQPVSEAAAECARIEAGRPRYGIDMTTETIPQEAGINERAISFTKGCYVGQETVARLHYRGKPNRHLRGLRLAAPTAPGDPVRAGAEGKEVGLVSSACVSPTLGPIALATLRREVEPGSEVEVGEDSPPATVVELPFQASGHRTPA